MTSVGHIQKCHQCDDIKYIYIFKTKFQDFKTNNDQHRANGKIDIGKNLGCLLASDVDSPGESFLWVVL